MGRQRAGKNRLLYRIVTILIVFSMLSGNTLQITQAKTEEPPEEYRGETINSVGLVGSAVIQEESFGIAWGDPDGPHSVYDWPFTFQQMGLVIQSYQNYSGLSTAYFHHGIDMIAPNGTKVYTRSGGQVVNVENYQPGNSLYWEVAILDDEGYVWQYHHIDEPTIPDLIYQKFAEWQANPETGGYIPPNTHIGNIIYWPVVSLGYRFNHIHLNILAAGDVYLNGLEFHTPLVDNQIPEIQEIGLLNGDTVVSGNTATGNYGMYVRARDLMMSPVYYLPPHKTEFSIDGGEWVTVWEFHNFPGGFDDHQYVNDFFVPGYTEGDYEDRDFYIDLGFTTEGQRAFPSEPGEHNIEVCVWDYYSNYTCDTFSWNVVTAIPDNGCGSGNGVTRTFQVTEDLLVTDVNLGVNLSHASRGQVRVTLKSPTDTTATTIIDTSSDTYDNYDLWVDDSSSNSVNDGSNDSVAAPYFDRTAGPSANGALDSFNGESAFGEWTVFICDNVGGTTGTVNLIDLDVVGVISGNEPPIADDMNITTDEDVAVGVTLSGSDPDGDALSFTIVDQPGHGTLSGTAPVLTYTPDTNYNGPDSFTYVANDGMVDSELATVSLTITSVNDAPVAQNQSVSTEVNVPVAIELAGLDVDGDSLSFTVLTDPEYGSLSGTAPSLQYTPITGYTGSDSFTYSVSDGELDSEIATISITITPPGPVQIFWDDFESDLGWVVNPYNNDAATTGVWERANPEGTDSSGSVMQLGETISGTNNLVTGALAGSSVGSYDIDGGDTTILSPEITLPGGRELTLSFYYYLAHLNNATADDYLRVSVLGETSQLVFEELGAANTDIATWESYSADISSYSGQSIRLLIEAADAGTASLVEAAIDDVLIQGLLTNNPPVADSQSVVTDEDMAVGVTLSGSDPEGAPLTYTVVTQPLHGNLSGTAPDLTYTPDANFNGSDSFTFKVNDGTVDSNIATVTITVTPVNDAPVADNQSVSTAEDTAKTIVLVGTDVDGNPLTYTIVTQPMHGALSGDVPNVTYTPTANFNGSDSFTFKVNDGTLDSNTSTITITVTNENDAPIADDQSVSTAEDTAKTIVLTGADVESSPLTYNIVTSPAHGSLSGTGPDVTYTPSADYNGSDSFTFIVNDGTVDSNIATVTITVTPVNDAPVADDQSVSTAEDTAKTIVLVGTDLDGNPLTYTIVTQPMHGALSGDVPNVTYTPTANFNGSDSFTFKVNDGEADSNIATVSLTVTAVNDAPVADGQSVSTAEDTATAITLTGSDIESSSLTFTIVNQPVNGTLSGSAPNMTYTPSADYNGSDSFTFRVSDGQTNSATATVNISITPVNDTPVAQDQNIGTTQDTPVDVTLYGSDIDGDPLTYAVSTSPTHGTLSGTAPNLTYTPNSGYIGADSFEFTVYDGSATSLPATVSISISNVNDAPVADGQTLSTPEDTSLSITLSGSDADNDPLTYTIISQPAHGTLSGTAPDLTYKPDANFNGSDSFTFKVNDGTVDSNIATVTITVTPVNDAPVADDQSVITAEDTAKAITLTGTDVDYDTLTYSIVSQPAHGTLNIIGPDVSYTPAANFNGNDSFTFKVNDGTVDSNTATISITVTAVNDSPVADSQSVETSEDIAVEILLTGSDKESSPLTYNIVTPPAHGTLDGSAPNVTYTPDANFNGLDSFTFKVNDGTLDSNIATVTITVTPVNDAPVADDQTVSTAEDTAKTIVLVGTDLDGNPLTYTIVTQPMHGALSGDVPNVTYTPAANYNGPESFTFKVNDGTIDSNTATVSITVAPVNDVPVAIDQEIGTAEDTSLAVTLSGSDADNDPLTYRVITQPAHGTITGDAPALTYIPEENFYGADSFTFVANDGTIDSAPATVTISIDPVNDAPIANGQAVVTSENTAVEITLTGTDVENSALAFSIQSGPFHGTLTETGATWEYMPELGYEGEDSFTFIANDGELNSGSATVSITVTRINEPPVADEQTVSTNEDVARAVTLTGSDPDNDPITYVVSANPSHGTLSGTAPNLTYTPDGNYHGPDSFSFVVNDGLVDSPEATIAITVLSVNDAPVAEPQSVTVVEDTDTVITLSGSDIDEDDLTYTIMTGPSHGSLSGTGSIKTYTPAANYNGTDTFTFKVNDGTIDSSIATVTITVIAVNDAPFAINQSVNTAEDTAKPITLSGSDAEGNPLTYSIVTSPAHGSLSASGPNVTYTPTANYNGPDSFTFKVNDGTVDSNIAAVTITVTPVNDVPLADDQSVSTAEDTAKAITLTGTDVDYDTLTYSIVSQPAHGTLNVIGPDVNYTPAANYNGSDSFTFKVNDGTIDSNIATVTITVTAMNDAPVADNQSVSTAEDVAAEVTLTGSDLEANPLTYVIVTPPAHGTLGGSAPNVTYTPDANYNGPDSFTFRVYDGQANSAPATVSITIAPVNDAPIALAQSVSVDEDASVDIVLAGSDVDGDGLTYVVVTGPVHGTLSGTVPNLVYAPISNYNGSDTFTFTVSDGTFVSAPATIEISIRPVNDLPVAEGQEVTTNENAPVTITLVGSDIDGDDLDYIIESGPLFGGLTGTAPNLVYTPNDYYSGTDVFSFYVSDGISNSNSAEVTILILDINYLPIVYNQTVSTNENSPLAIILAGMDPDGDALSFFTKSAPAHGVLSGTAPNLVYTPNPGYTGSDSFTFAASDQEGESNEAVVSIQVTPSGPLTVFFDDFETDLGWTRNAFGTDTANLGWFERADPESVSYYGDKQLGTTVSGSYDLVTGPLAGYSAGSYDLDGGTTSMLSPMIELPTGRDLEMSFSYYVAHYTNSSTADYLRVYVIGDNTIEIFEELGANNDDDAVWETFDGNISNFGGQTIQILIEAADASTASLFEAAVDDILILATTPNNPPVAESQSHEIAEDANLELTLAGSDPNGDDITFLIETPPSHGSLSGTLPNLVYSPDNNYNGIDSFTYVVNDGKLDSEPATISLTITPVNDAPQAIAQTVSTSMDTRLDITLAGTDVDGDALQFNITSFPTVGILGGYVPNMVYIPLEGYIGEDSFTFVVFDGVEESLPATVNISVNAAGPMTIFWDDFETDQGWVFDPFGTDTATVGTLERANPETVLYNGDKQLGTTVSGLYDLVTGPLAGRSAGDYDLDGGVTTVRSPNITLPSGRDLTLSFSYYFAHASNSTSSDYLRVRIVGSTTTTLFQEVGARNDDDARWETFTVSLDSFAGQTVYLIIDAADAYTASFVEAAIDDVLIIAE